MPRVNLNLDALLQKKIVYLSPGHAPAIVTTVGPKGNINVATFEQIMVVSYRPPRILLAISPKSDTYKNIMDGSDCVIGFPKPHAMQMAYDMGVKVPRDISELDIVSNVTAYPSHIVIPPSLEECWINFECSLYSDTDAGDHHLIVCDVQYASVDNTILKDSSVEQRNSLPAVYYTTCGNFFTPGNFHTVHLSSTLAHYRNGD